MLTEKQLVGSGKRLYGVWFEKLQRICRYLLEQDETDWFAVSEIAKAQRRFWPKGG